jgi:hypothetical protein
MNAKWHEANPMPKNPTVEQRIRWHLAHQEQCKCRPIPAKLVPLIAESKVRDASGGSRPSER